jgi:hypothetical protein
VGWARFIAETFYPTRAGNRVSVGFRRFLGSRGRPNQLPVFSDPGTDSPGPSRILALHRSRREGQARSCDLRAKPLACDNRYIKLLPGLGLFSVDFIVKDMTVIVKLSPNYFATQ